MAKTWCYFHQFFWIDPRLIYKLVHEILNNFLCLSFMLHLFTASRHNNLFIWLPAVVKGLTYLSMIKCCLKRIFLLLLLGGPSYKWGNLVLNLLAIMQRVRRSNAKYVNTLTRYYRSIMLILEANFLRTRWPRSCKLSSLWHCSLSKVRH